MEAARAMAATTSRPGRAIAVPTRPAASARPPAPPTRPLPRPRPPLPACARKGPRGPPGRPAGTSSRAPSPRRRSTRTLSRRRRRSRRSPPSPPAPSRGADRRRRRRSRRPRARAPAPDRRPRRRPGRLGSRPSARCPSASPGNTGELSLPADACTCPTLPTNPDSCAAENAPTATTTIADRDDRPRGGGARRRAQPRASMRRPPVASVERRARSATAEREPGEPREAVDEHARDHEQDQRHDHRPLRVRLAALAGRRRPSSPSATAKASTRSAIAVSLKALWARNEAARYGRPVERCGDARGARRAAARAPRGPPAR